MANDPESLLARALAEIAAAGDDAGLQECRRNWLGPKSELLLLLRSVGSLPAAERAETGRRANEAKRRIESEIESRAAALRESAEASLADREWSDLTLPGRAPRRGHVHPIAQVEQELDELFTGMGFRVVEGPWVEDEFHNFDALNVPHWHPSRDAWDTFWLSDGNLLRTHTSPVQIRSMRRFGAPLRAVLPGRCFRNEAVDATHEAVFNQIEGIVIDRDITPGHLFHSVNSMLGAILKDPVTTRFRRGYFPFTEPSFECDVARPDGSWMEICGMGMIHPAVLRAGGIDPEAWTGFAFGLGIDRLAMMRFGVDDIRWFHSGDLRFLEQF
jgi:phenylalanyl-tRNA synthetase alpha chain